MINKFGLILLLALGCVPAAIASENLMEGATLSGPFADIRLLQDNLQAETATPVVSEQVGSKSIRLEIDLQELNYLKALRIIWDKSGVPRNYSLWLSKSKVDNTVISGLDGTQGKFSAAGYLQEIPLNSSYARYITIFIPADVMLNVGDRVRIKEIQLIKEENTKLWVSNLKSLSGDCEASVVFSSNIDAKSQIYYREDKPNASWSAPLRFFMPRTEHSGVLYGLKADTRYQYKVEVSTPRDEQIFVCELQDFTTAKVNLAAGRSVSGTFSYLPEGRFIKPSPPALERLTDGSMDFFSSMAQSGSIKSGDQFVSIDLGDETQVSQVLLYWWALAYPRDFSLQGSRDGISWTILSEGLDVEKGFYTTTGTTMYALSCPLVPVRARYLKLVIPKGSRYYNKQDNRDTVSLFEIKVF